MALSNSARFKTTFNVPEANLYIDQGALMPRPIIGANDWKVDGVWAKNQEAEDIVNQVLDSSQEMVDKYSELALEALENLGNFPVENVGYPNITLNLPTAPSVDAVTIPRPGRPTYTLPDTSDIPTLRGDIQTPVFNEVERPTIVYPDEPTEELNWSELAYLSSLLDNLKDSVNSIILNGGTGLDSDWEDAIWDRAVSRLNLAHEEKYEEAENYYSSKGHVAPPGALVARLNMLNAQRLEQEALITSDIAAKQYEIAHEHIKFNKELAQRIEAMTIDHKNKVEDRALDAAKTTIGLLYEKYKVAMDGLSIKVEIYKTDVAAEATRVEAIAAANKSLTDTLQAEIDGWTARVNAEFGVIESIIKMFVADMGGYEAEVRAGAVELNALIERYKAQVGASEVQGQISLGEYENYIKYILGKIDLTLGSEKEVGRIAAQVASAALSSFNASTSLSDSASRTRSFGEQRSMSTSNAYQTSISNALGIQYSMSDDAQDSYQESFSYSGT